MSRRVVAITGGTGFIGRALAERHIRDGDVVRVLSRGEPPASGEYPWHVFQGDLGREGEDLVPFVDGADIVYHCAADLRDVARMIEVNVAGTQRLLAAARGRAGRWVQLSSVGVYGQRRDGVVSESDPERPAGPYETTKAAADRAVRDEPGLAYSILRPSNVFGVAMSNQSLRQWIAMVDRGLFVFVGSPGASANYLHVSNVVEARVKCATSPQAVGQTYIVSDFREIERFVGAISAALGRRPPRVRMPERLALPLATVAGAIPGIPFTRSRVEALTTRVVYSPARIVSDLGFRNVTSVEDGIREMVADYRSPVVR